MTLVEAMRPEPATITEWIGQFGFARPAWGKGRVYVPSGALVPDYRPRAGDRVMVTTTVNARGLRAIACWPVAGGQAVP